jgi:CRP-like cAMP-binding protein
MEECDLLVATYDDMNELAERIPAWKKIISTVDQQKFNQQMKRAIQLQTLTAAERYQLFMEKHPDILRRVALKHVASYLGIDIATLSRIRRNL